MQPMTAGAQTMGKQVCFRRYVEINALILLGAICLAFQASAAPAFTPIDPAKADKIITLDGHSLSIDQIVDVARYGAKVELSADARRRQQDNYGLLLEATAEGISVYWFNRATGDQRETVLFVGDATSGVNRANAAMEGLSLDALDDATMFPIDGIQQSPDSPVDGRRMKRADTREVSELVEAN